MEAFFSWLIPLATLSILGLKFSIGYRDFRDRGRPLRPALPPDALFGEARASGHPETSLFTRLGGASRILLVSITRDAFAVESGFPLNLLMPHNSFECRVPINRVFCARQVDGKSVRVSYADDDNRTRVLRLYLQDPARFAAVMGSLGVAEHTGGAPRDFLREMGVKVRRQMVQWRVQYRHDSVRFSGIEREELVRALNVGMAVAVRYYRGNVSRSGYPVDAAAIREISLSVVLEFVQRFLSWRRALEEHKNHTLAITESDLATAPTRATVAYLCKQKFGLLYADKAAALTGMTREALAAMEASQKAYSDAR